jgi:hypothetical protein
MGFQSIDGGQQGISLAALHQPGAGALHQRRNPLARQEVPVRPTIPFVRLSTRPARRRRSP